MPSSAPQLLHLFLHVVNGKRSPAASPSSAGIVLHLQRNPVQGNVAWNDCCFNQEGLELLLVETGSRHGRILDCESGNVCIQLTFADPVPDQARWTYAFEATCRPGEAAIQIVANRIFVAVVRLHPTFIHIQLLAGGADGVQGAV